MTSLVELGTSKVATSYANKNGKELNRVSFQSTQVFLEEQAREALDPRDLNLITPLVLFSFITYQNMHSKH